MRDPYEPPKPKEEEQPAVKIEKPQLVSKQSDQPSPYRQIYNQLNQRLWMFGGRFTTFTGYGIFTDGPNHEDRQRMRLVVGDQLEAKLLKDHQQGKAASQQQKAKAKRKKKSKR